MTGGSAPDERPAGEEPPPDGEGPTVELTVDDGDSTAELTVDDGDSTAELLVAGQPAPPRREPGRRGRGLRWSLLVLVVVLGGLLVVADRIGIGYAEQMVAEQVAAELARNQVASEQPEVTIEGTPFLTQVVRGRYQRVQLNVTEIRTPEVVLFDVELVATGVAATVDTLIAREGPIDAALVEGRATIAYAEVVPLIGVEGLELSAGQDGAVRVRLPLEVLGQQVIVAGEAEVRVTEDGRLDLRVRELAVEESNGVPPLAEPLLVDLLGRLSLDTRLPPLPYGLTVDSVRAEPDGLVVTVSATDVPLAR